MTLLEKVHEWIHTNLPQCDANVELHEGLVVLSSADVTIELHPDYAEVFVDAGRSMRIGRSGFFLSGRKEETGYATEHNAGSYGSVFNRRATQRGYSFLFRQSLRNYGDGIRITAELELEYLRNEFAERLTATAVFYEQDGQIRAETLRVNDAYRLCMHLKRALRKYIKTR